MQEDVISAHSSTHLFNPTGLPSGVTCVTAIWAALVPLLLCFQDSELQSIIYMGWSYRWHLLHFLLPALACSFHENHRSGAEAICGNICSSLNGIRSFLWSCFRTLTSFVFILSFFKNQYVWSHQRPNTQINFICLFGEYVLSLVSLQQC